MAATRLRPLAPLAVIGAGLMIMSFATRPASADDSPVPQNVQVVPTGTDLVVSWAAPTQSDGLTDYDVRVAASGRTILERAVAATDDTARITSADLAGETDVTITVSADFGSDKRIPASPLAVTLTAGLPKPTSAPAVQVEGHLLTVRIPTDAVTGATGRVVRILRDGSPWTTVSVPLEKTVLKKRVAAGHDYAVEYQVVGADAESPFSEQSDAVTVGSGMTGPSAVKIKVRSVDTGVKVAWSAAQGPALHGYSVRVVKDGERVGTAYTVPEVRSVVVPTAATTGALSVTVTATDAAGRTSSSTATLQP